MAKDKDKDYQYKFDQGKSRIDLICPEFIDGIGQILSYGASKYEDTNSWKKVPRAKDRYYAAAMRHLLAYRRGENIDYETCKSHLLHAACNLMFLEYFERKEAEADLAKINLTTSKKVLFYRRPVTE